MNSYIFFFEFRISESEFRFLNLSTAEFEKNFLTGIFGIKKELEFRFQWGSQKSEPKIGIPNQDFVMFEADSHLKLLPTSILNIYKVFEHIDMLSIGIW